jgi:hypothetical protein
VRPTPYPPLREFHPNRPGLVEPVTLDPTGLTGPTRAQARGKRWRRTSKGYFVPVTVDGSLVEQRIVEASSVLTTHGGVTGWAQLRWSGGRWFDGLAAGGRELRPVDLGSALTDLRSQPGIRISHEHLDLAELMWVDGLPVTTSLRSLLFEVRHARTLVAAVTAIDMAAYSDLVSLAEFDDYVARHPGWPGIRQARAARDLADENSWSPREVWLRLVWMTDAGFPRPLMNVPVFDREGRHIGTPDLLDVRAGVAGEYEGADAHLDAETRHRDLTREDAFRRVGLEYFTVVSRDARNRERLVARMTAARSRAPWLAEEQRRWSVVPPARWIPTLTVAQRRALTADQARRWLAHRQ